MTKKKLKLLVLIKTNPCDEKVEETPKIDWHGNKMVQQLYKTLMFVDFLVNFCPPKLISTNYNFVQNTSENKSEYIIRLELISAISCNLCKIYIRSGQ